VAYAWNDPPKSVSRAAGAFYRAASASETPHRPALYALRMRGAVAAGNPHSAEAGAWALREGGTAVDAAIAATLAAFVTEGPLTGPAGGGFALLHEPASGAVLLDCFFAVPSRDTGEMDEVEIDFVGSSTQVFHVGGASVAVPGLVAGLLEAHLRRGRLPWERLFVPALELAGRELAASPAQLYLHEILATILHREPGGRRVYGVPGYVDARDLVPALRLLQQARVEAVALLLPDLAEDLASYEVEVREPLECGFAGATVRTTPPPSLGGAIVRAGLETLEERSDDPSGSPQEARSLAAALAAGYGIAGPGAAAGLKPTGTTHVSAIDADGAAVGISSTLGSGSGVFRHGFQLNNMLGELDVIGTDARKPGARLPSMMAPTLVLEEDAPRLVVGSAGSVRLSGAILQVVAAVARQGIPVAEAIARPRLHVDGVIVHLEGGWADGVADALLEDGYEVVRWDDRNLFFGGASAVERRSAATLGAAGDPRRGGHGIVIW
jgi:gamma-glutamyltranspeptidase / glutathione hydrolase